MLSSKQKEDSLNIKNLYFMQNTQHCTKAYCCLVYVFYACVTAEQEISKKDTLNTGCQESSRSIFKFNVIQKLQ